MLHYQAFIHLVIILSFKNSVFAVPVPTHNGDGLLGGLVDDILGAPTYTTQNDRNQHQTIFVTQYVTSPTSLAEPVLHEHPTTALLVSSYVQSSVGPSSIATAAFSTAMPVQVPEGANPTTTRIRQPEPTKDTPSYHNTSLRPAKGPIVAGYYPDWASGSLSPEQVDWRTFDWVDFGVSCNP